MIDWRWLVITSISGFLLGYVLTFIIVNCSWKYELIRRNLARYNPTSGEWEWKD